MSDQSLDKETFPVNHDPRGITIRRGKHDREHPYVHISKAMIRDPALSIRDKGALCYLLSLPDDWITHPRQVAESLGIGKDQMYDILKSLIRAGYATRSATKLSNGKFTNVVYSFYEEKLSEPQKIEEKSTVSENPDTENPDPVNQTLLKNDSTEKRSNTLLKVPKGTEERVDFSSEVKEAANAMIDSMRMVKPDYAAANGKLLGIWNEIDRMMRLDKREIPKILEVFRWALADSFWADKMFKPNPAKYLREKFDQLEMKMIAKPVDPNKIDRRTKNMDGTPVDNPQYKGRF